MTLKPIAHIALSASCGLIICCAALLDFEREDLPCGPELQCLEGYSCLVTSCVRNGSVAEGGSCFVNEHCGPDQVCGGGSNVVCRPACQDTYGDHNQCPPSTDEAGQSIQRLCVRLLNGAMVESAGCVEAGCAACPDTMGSRVCAEIDSAGRGICVDSCTIECDDFNGCQGFCPADENDERVSQKRGCQPLGASKTLACMEVGEAVHGQACNLRDLLCARSAACLKAINGTNGVCLRYCETLEDCAGLSDPTTGEDASCVDHGTFSSCGIAPD